MKNSLLIILFLVGLTSCESSSSNEAYTFNQQMIASHSSIMSTLINSTNKAEGCILSNNKLEMIKVSETALEKILDARAKFDKVSVPKVPRADDLKSGYMNILIYYKNIFDFYIKIGNSKNSKESLKNIESLQALVKNLDKAEGMMENLQRDFANSNGLKMNENSMNRY
jgi:hypothetical protein